MSEQMAREIRGLRAEVARLKLSRSPEPTVREQHLREEIKRLKQQMAAIIENAQKGGRAEETYGHRLDRALAEARLWRQRYEDLAGKPVVQDLMLERHSDLPTHPDNG